jgi:hypothetical protein
MEDRGEEFRHAPWTSHSSGDPHVVGTRQTGESGVVDEVPPSAQRDSLNLTVDIGFEFGRAMAILGCKSDRPVIPRPGADLLTAFEELGADAELIWIIASFGCTHSQEQTLAALRQWNNRSRPSDLFIPSDTAGNPSVA